MKPISLVLLTGFLGSGKTTWLNRVLGQVPFERTLVIINEFGAVSLDHMLVETADDSMIELSNGCACCMVRSDLIAALLALDTKRFDRVIVEMTGIADPGAVLQAIGATPELQEILLPPKVFCLVDGAQGTRHLNAHGEAQRQVAFSDTLIVSKRDLALDDDKNLENLLFSLNPHAPHICSLDMKAAMAAMEKSSMGQYMNIGPVQQGSHRYRSVLLELDFPLALNVLAGFCHHAVSRFGYGLLRLKGLAFVEGEEQPVLVQVSGRIVSDFHPVPKWPDGHRRKTRLVAIVDGIDPNALRECFLGFMGQPVLDAPDSAAVNGNPLAVSGEW